MDGFFRKAAMVIAAGFVMAVAGTASAEVIAVKVPFAFVVNHQTLPAGEYRVERDPMASSVLLIRSAQPGNEAAMFVLTIPVDGHNPSGNSPALTFTQYETAYRLTGVWETSDSGREIPGSATPSKRIARVVVPGVMI